MRMTLKIAIFYLVVAATKFGDQRYGILSQLGISGAQIVVFLLLFYLALLVWEVAERIKYEKDVRGVRTAGFILSFMVGGVFGIFGAYTGNPEDVSLGLIVTNFIATGAVLGMIAALLSGAIFKAARSKRDKLIHVNGTGCERPSTGGDPPVRGADGPCGGPPDVA